jgi:hypothetical protein
VSVCDPTKVCGSATASMNDNGRPISCYFWILLQARWCRKISWNSCELVGLSCSNWHYSRTTNAGDGMEIVSLFIRKWLICQGCWFRREERKFLRAESSLLVDHLNVCNMYEKINMSNFIQNYVQNVQQHANKV